MRLLIDLVDFGSYLSVSTMTIYKFFVVLGKTERQKDRKAERQKDRKTERKKEIKKERQEDRQTDRQKVIKKTERQ